MCRAVAEPVLCTKYGWYWGPISSEAAEKVLSNEPDGSFIVRDSSDDHYIFSLTLKLNNSVRHVRIEHDQGNFSFGSCTKFKSQTIVEFIENAVEHSRSGRYLFFLHRRSVIGPVRVQLLHPVSRLKQIQSLQHMCRFVILKLVRRDLLCKLPLPRRMTDYLNTPYYYSEQLSDVTEEQEENNVVPLFSNAQITQNTVVIVNNNAITTTTRSNPSGTSNSSSNDRQS
ncbi:suppressor of cytokine signaling 7-like [Photinus pyralis]|uniref:suppressor of cytokine signaling 7-like n=1 Tax=Photinus pyralis TaxID=7054 RepID=UPI00126778AB|nr:suppressor of cytokine signaling 7-like [Photinus pyralis]